LWGLPLFQSIEPRGQAFKLFAPNQTQAVTSLLHFFLSRFGEQILLFLGLRLQLFEHRPSFFFAAADPLLQFAEQFLCLFLAEGECRSSPSFQRE
jgi:hypothetical protein